MEANGVPELAGPENLFAVAGLFTCPDCQHNCSNFAETCPGCGRYFRSYARIVSVNRNNWSITVFWGIMLAWIIPMLLGFALIVLFIFMGVGAASLVPAPRDMPTSRP